jgi:hypothetical protein
MTATGDIKGALLGSLVRKLGTCVGANAVGSLFTAGQVVYRCRPSKTGLNIWQAGRGLSLFSVKLAAAVVNAARSIPTGNLRTPKSGSLRLYSDWLSLRYFSY